MNRLKRIATVGLIAALTAGGASLAAAGTAQAASAPPVLTRVASSSVLSPDIATYCNGNYLCMDAPIVSGANYVITDWTPTYTFVGHWELQLPKGAPQNSKSKLNHLGRSNGWKFTVPRVHGKYCSTAWADKSKNNHVKLGYVCYQV
ncbi:MAG: hypothetical protein M3Z75_01175 [Actinomycetota bacterium]|nr:hypothetical protein [Actinomycetota bacterium]